MADLENNLETAIAEVMTEANGQQPDAKAEKGDQKPVKQGSSDAASIESGKGEVVKPEENPVDKAVASVKSASNTKEVSGDPQQKGEAPAEPQPKLKKVAELKDEDEDKPSKMAMIKAMVDKMKGMDKQELMKLKMDMSDEEEVDESLTKAEIARSIVELMKKKDDEDVEEGYNKINSMKDPKMVKAMKDKKPEDMQELKKEDEDEDDEKVVKSMKEPMKKDEMKDPKMVKAMKDKMKDSEDDVKEEASIESDLVEIEIEDDLSKISEALELSEENSEKARTIFKAAVSSKVEEIKEQLESEYSENLKTSVDQVKEDLSEAVDKYLTFCAEEWTKENELAIERGLRSEMTENFIEGLKNLFVEHYVEVPEEKYNVMDELANRLDEMEDKLDNEVSKNMGLTEEVETLKRDNIVRQACSDLSESQVEKLVSLSNGVDFIDESDFAEKIGEIKEAYFPSDGETIAEETVVEEGTGDFSEEKETILDPAMNQYSTAISKLKPLG
tara:strand:+ start:56459 stop:57961 length:1503 start_codon:yes stop_codon:yes gene_type:complete